MTDCKNCHGRAQVFLCPDCIAALDDLLHQMPWLLSQLEVTRTRQDKLTVGAVGRGSNPSPINVGAMELAREIEGVLTEWVDTMCVAGLTFLPALSMPYGVEGPLLPGWKRLPRGYSGSPTQRISWLTHHLPEITRHELAGDFFSAIADLVGDPDHPDTKPGRLILAINRSERLFAGTCPTIIGYDREGKPMECGVSLYGDSDQQTVVCARCQYEIDISRNRSRCAVDRDLLTEPKLLSLLADLGEDVSRVRFYEWLKDGKVAVRGWVHQGHIVAHRIRRGDPRVFSLSQIRILRTQELQMKAAV